MEYDSEIVFMEKTMSAWTALQRVPDLAYAYNPRELVFQIGKIRLFHYTPKVANPLAVPLLIVFATVNRPEILDLFPDQSLIGILLKNGIDVYLLDWGYPDSEDQATTFSDYVTEYLAACVRCITKSTKHNKINLLGICQGGLISLCYASLMETINKLVLISVPIDFSTPDNIIAKIFERLDGRLLANHTGNVSGFGLTQFFIGLRPFELVGKKYLRFVDQITNEITTEKFLQVEKWLYDAPDQPGQAFFELISNFYQQNKLIKGEISINQQIVNLNQLTMPILNIIADQDEIVPPSASICLKNYIAAENYTEKHFPSGHIGIYISSKVGEQLAKSIADWLKDGD